MEIQFEKHYLLCVCYVFTAFPSFWRLIWAIFSQFQLRPSPPGNCGAFACLVSPGGGTLANLARPGVGHLPTPRLLTHTGLRLEIQTWRILSQRTSSSSQIGSSVKDWTNLWRFSRFYAFLHCLSRHNYHFI